MHCLVKDEVTQCSPMLTALVMNQLLVGAYILDGGEGPVLILKMPALSAKVINIIFFDYIAKHITHNPLLEKDFAITLYRFYQNDHQ